MIKLKNNFPSFYSKLTSTEDTDIEEILTGLTDDEIKEQEESLNIKFPESYKIFLKHSAGFWLFGGAVQFGSEHPFFHDFPPYESFTAQQQNMIKMKGGPWPPASHGMLCFAEYFKDADGDQVLFDVKNGLINGEYPVMYYSHDDRPPSVTKIADSFEEFLNEYCIDNIK